jgi:hypothetical protein
VGTAFRVAYAQQLAGEEEVAPPRRPARGATAPRQPARGAGRLPGSRSVEDLLAGAGGLEEPQGRGGTRSEPGEDRGPSYSVLDPGPCPALGTLAARDPPCPAAGRGLSRSCSGQAVTACEVYSDVFQVPKDLFESYTMHYWAAHLHFSAGLTPRPRSPWAGPRASRRATTQASAPAPPAPRWGGAVQCSAVQCRPRVLGRSLAKQGRT